MTKERWGKLYDFVGNSHTINGFPVRAEEPFSPEGMEDDYSLQPFIPKVGKENGDGTVFCIKQHKSTRVVRVETDSIARDFFDSGSGWLLVQDGGAGEITINAVGDQLEPKDYTYKKGDVITWIAGSKGLKVINIFTPPFVFGKTESVVEVDDPTISQDFWDAYHTLRLEK